MGWYRYRVIGRTVYVTIEGVQRVFWLRLPKSLLPFASEDILAAISRSTDTF